MCLEPDLLQIGLTCFAISARSNTPLSLRTGVAECLLCNPLQSNHVFLLVIFSDGITFDVSRKPLGCGHRTEPVLLQNRDLH